MQNLFHVVRNAKGELVIMGDTARAIPREDALNLAAWLVVLADPGGERFGALMSEVFSDDPD